MANNQKQDLESRKFRQEIGAINRTENISKAEKKVLVDNFVDQKAQEIIKKITKKVDWPKKESVEDLDTLPILADENFRIDSSSWKNIVEKKGVKFKINSYRDSMECLEWTYKGEQYFNEEATLREVYTAGKTLPASSLIYQNILDNKYKGNYHDFLKWEKITSFSWIHHNLYPTPGDCVGIAFFFRCADGSWVTGKISSDFFCTEHAHPANFMPIRCVKN